VHSDLQQMSYLGVFLWGTQPRYAPRYEAQIMRVSLMCNEKAICDTSTHVDDGSNGEIDGCSHSI